MGNNYYVTIAGARVSAGLTQRELAEILHVTTQTVCSWESGKTEPLASQLKKISELAKVPMDCILLENIV